MTTTATNRWPIWTDVEAGSAMAATSRPTRVYRLADGGYLTVFPDGTELATSDRPATPGGDPIPLQWCRLVAHLLPGPATEALVAELEVAAGSPDRDLLWRLATALASNPDAPVLLVAEGVRVVCERGWVGSKTKSRNVTIKVTYFL